MTQIRIWHFLVLNLQERLLDKASKTGGEHGFNMGPPIFGENARECNPTTGALPEDVFLQTCKVSRAFSPTTVSTNISQQSCQSCKDKEEAALFVSTGMALVCKKSLDKILHKNLGNLFENKKYANMFKDYDICI